ncbi:MAG: hypothetical protein IAI49_01530 [Candidatus Eremiobacteraeota bacterium]|nr:hypothetical protein [Candidatus Eremiobacteraeota bacterium]
MLCGGGCGSFASDINAAGTIVGSYTDKYVVSHGFIRSSAGRYLSFDAPGAGLGHGLDEGTVPYAIDPAGGIVGIYLDENVILHGFVREVDGSFENFNVPGAGAMPGQGTIAWDLYDGETAGYYVDNDYAEHGFVRSRGGQITTFDPPGSVHTHVCQIDCLNYLGVVGGFIRSDGVVHGFLREPSGKITQFDAPGAGQSPGQGTAFYGINLEGAITGIVIDSNDLIHGFLRYPNGSYVIGEVQGSGTGAYQGTLPYGINALAAVTGIFLDSNYGVHGFERFFSGAVARFDAPDAAPALGGTEPAANDIFGDVVGAYTDANGLNHSFLWKP